MSHVKSRYKGASSRWELGGEGKGYRKSSAVNREGEGRAAWAEGRRARRSPVLLRAENKQWSELREWGRKAII